MNNGNFSGHRLRMESLSICCITLFRLHTFFFRLISLAWLKGQYLKNGSLPFEFFFREELLDLVDFFFFFFCRTRFFFDNIRWSDFDGGFYISKEWKKKYFDNCRLPALLKCLHSSPDFLGEADSKYISLLPFCLWMETKLVMDKALVIGLLC